MRTVNGMPAATSPLTSAPPTAPWWMPSPSAAADRQSSGLTPRRSRAGTASRCAARTSRTRSPSLASQTLATPDSLSPTATVAQTSPRCQTPSSRFAAVDPGHARRGRVGDRHVQPHQRDVVVPGVGDQPGGRRMRVERDADLAEAARERDHVVGQRRSSAARPAASGASAQSPPAAHLHAREELRVPHARAIRERTADDRRARRRRPLPAPLRPDRLGASDARHDAQRRDVGAARGGTAAAEVVAGLDVAAPAGHVGSEVVRQRVLAGARVGRARQEEQDGCHELAGGGCVAWGDDRPAHCHVSVPIRRRCRRRIGVRKSRRVASVTRHVDQQKR